MTEESNLDNNINLRKPPRGHNFKLIDQRGENNPMWKGGAPVQDKDGYWLIYKPDHPNRNSRNKVFLHRLLYEHYLSILLDEEVYLNRDEEIHHINLDKEDNSLINLQYMPSKKDHRREHRQSYEGVRCKKCGSDKTGIRKDNGRPRWIPDKDGEGYFCESCDKQRYYLQNKDRIEKYKQDNYDRILKKQKEYNDTKRKGRGVNK
jgi:hypothetical protein